MQNNNSKLNTFLVIILIILVAIGLWMLHDKNELNLMTSGSSEQHPFNNVPGLPSTDIEWKNYSGNGISFSYDSFSTVSNGTSQDGPFYNIFSPERKDYPDSINYYPNGLPSNFKMCDGLTMNTIYQNGKTFHYCDSQGEPIRTYFYGKAGKVVMVTVQIMDSYKTLINLGSIEIL